MQLQNSIIKLIFWMFFLSSMLSHAQQNKLMPAYSIKESHKFLAKKSDIKALLDSTGKELWQYFPHHKIEPILISHNPKGPIVLYKRNTKGEIVMHLSAKQRYWVQYAYQFAHEFTHVLAGYQKGYKGNLWFEEMICEAGSIFVLRAMARSWQINPPFPNWKGYRDALRAYADKVEAKHKKEHDIYTIGLPGYYKKNKKALRANPNLRNINGAMANIILSLFEEDPKSWEAIRWLNSKPSREGESFQTYLQKWHDAVPDRHLLFVKKIADLYEIKIKDKVNKPIKTASILYD